MQSTVTNEAAILGHVRSEASLSTRKLATTLELPRSSLQGILKRHRCYRYKVNLVQELNEDDPERRIQ